MKDLIDFQRGQLEVWPLAACNFAALEGVETRRVNVDGVEIVLQHNPGRMGSTGAKVDRRSVADRRCFLCGVNRPAEQRAIVWGDYEVLVNPFPIFPVHFTIAARGHVEQLITADGGRRLVDMLRMAREWEGLALFYNGARCGASAPDHFHFQAVERGRLPILDWERAPYRVERFEGDDEGRVVEWFMGLMGELALLRENEGEREPRVNVVCEWRGGRWRVVVIARRAHRPSMYGSGAGEVMVSPASVDLGGVVIVPRECDFREGITGEVLRKVFSEVCY